MIQYQPSFSRIFMISLDFITSPPDTIIIMRIIMRVKSFGLLEVTAVARKSSDFCLGRKNTRLTRELIDKAVQFLRAGNYKNTVAKLLGIPERTWYSWEERGRKIEQGEERPRGLYLDFYNEVKGAEAHAEGSAVIGVLKAGESGNWQALAWFLERKYPKKWGRRQVPLEADGETHDPIDALFAELAAREQEAP